MDVCNFNAPLGQYCCCDCHKLWCELIPPICNCNCVKQSFCAVTIPSPPPPYKSLNDASTDKIKSENDKEIIEIIKKLEKILTNLQNDVRELLTSRNLQINANKNLCRCPNCPHNIPAREYF